MKIKVCGLTTPADVGPCLEAGVDWVGLNFHPGSSRRVSLAAAAEIRAALDGRAQAVGLFVDRPAAEVWDVTTYLGLEIVQLHGSEPAESLVEYRDLFLIKAFRISGPESAASIADYLDRAERAGRSPDAILVDAHVPGVAGGTGVSIPDGLLDLIPPHPRLILAGGLTPANVADRAARARPWMVDVASGVESSPGRKCPEKVRAFAEAARRGLTPP